MAVEENRQHLRLHIVELADGDLLARTVREIRPEWVFHLAAYGAYSSQRDVGRIANVNFVGTVNLVQACLASGFEAFVNSGSSSEYGLKDHAPAETEALEPNSHYAVTKAAATWFCRHADSAEESRHASRTYARYLDRLLPDLADRAGALDIGAGDGAFLEELLSRGFTDLVGVEPSAAPIAAAREDVRPLLRQGLFRADDFPTTHFRLVTCFQTLEHVEDPLAIARGVRSLLQEGGAFFVVCHNRRALSAKVLGSKSPIFDVEHLQLFSPRSLRRLFEEAGFARVRVSWIRNRYPLHYWAKLPLPKGAKERLVRSLRRSRLGRAAVAIPAGNMYGLGLRA